MAWRQERGGNLPDSSGERRTEEEGLSRAWGSQKFSNGVDIIPETHVKKGIRFVQDELGKELEQHDASLKPTYKVAIFHAFAYMR